MTNVQRTVLLVLALAAAAVAVFLTTSGGDDEAAVSATATRSAASTTTATTTTATATTTTATTTAPAPAETVIRVAGGKPVGGLAEIAAKRGDTVRLEVTSNDTSEEVHVHGYDLKRDLAPGQPARFRFTADLDGIFEVELEQSATQLAELKVEP